jgi:hypothetical protein
MMKLYENLCCRDSRSPFFDDLYGYEDTQPGPPRQDCWCDNCFHRRDALTMQLLELMEVTKQLMDRIEGVQDWDPQWGVGEQLDRADKLIRKLEE